VLPIPDGPQATLDLGAPFSRAAILPNPNRHPAQPRCAGKAQPRSRTEPGRSQENVPPNVAAAAVSLPTQLQPRTPATRSTRQPRQERTDLSPERSGKRRPHHRIDAAQIEPDPIPRIGAKIWKICASPRGKPRPPDQT